MQNYNTIIIEAYNQLQDLLEEEPVQNRKLCLWAWLQCQDFQKEDMGQLPHTCFIKCPNGPVYLKCGHIGVPTGNLRGQ